MRGHAKENDARSDFHQTGVGYKFKGVSLADRKRERESARNARGILVYRRKSKIAILRSIIVLPRVSRDARFQSLPFAAAKEKRAKCERALKLQEVRDGGEK